MKYKSFLLIIIILIFSSFFSWRSYFKIYTQEDKINIHLFPDIIEKWNSRELTITEDEYDLLETKNVFAREYTLPEGNQIFFFTVYSESNRKVSHPPEICYTGSGVSVISSMHRYITLEKHNKVLKANRLLLEQGRVQQIAYYWFKIGDTFTSSYWKQQVLIAVYSLLGKTPSSALIRVSATVMDGNFSKAEEDIEKFIKLSMPKIFQYMP